MSEERELLLEEELKKGDDVAAIDQAKRDMLPTPGQYTTVPPLTLTAKINDKKDSSWFGRLMLMYYGVARREYTVTDANGNEKVQIEEQRFRFIMSPQRIDIKSTGKPDTATQLYIQARALFEQAAGRPAESREEIANYVANYPVVLRVTRGREEAEVRGISAVRN